MQTQRKRYLTFLIPLCIAGLLAGCTKTQLVIPPGAVPEAAPGAAHEAAPEAAAVKDWSQEPSGAYTVDRDRLFYGIGRAAGSTNPTLLRATADTQAQQELVRLLNAYFSRLLTASGWQGEPDEAEQLIYGLSQAALQRARITDHRFDEPEKTLSARCSLPLTALEQTLQNSPYLGTALKKEMLSRAEDVHQQWAAAH